MVLELCSRCTLGSSGYRKNLEVIDCIFKSPIGMRNKKQQIALFFLRDLGFDTKCLNCFYLFRDRFFMVRIHPLTNRAACPV